MKQSTLKRLALLLGGLVLLVLSISAGQFIRRSPTVACTPTRVLFVGNSYTYVHNIPELLVRLGAESSPAQCIETAMIAQGGATLQNHWDGGIALQTIQSGDWDFVVLQEQSMVPLLNQAEMASAVRDFNRAITASDARTVLFVTWARQFSPENQAQISAVYLDLGRELGALVVPVGSAWAHMAQIDPGIRLYDSDQSHPAPAGAYLTACVFYATLFDRSPAGLDRLGVVSAREARALQDAAWASVSQRR